MEEERDAECGYGGLLIGSSWIEGGGTVCVEEVLVPRDLPIVAWLAGLFLSDPADGKGWSAS
jgi:hypothetical protein